MSEKKIFCVHPGHSFSTTIWHHGLGNGLAKLGHDVTSYPLNTYIDFYNLVSRRIPDSAGIGLGPREVCNLACQPLTIDILREEPDWVIVITGQYIHESVWGDLVKLRDLVGTKIAVVLTESPYMDSAQEGFTKYSDVVTTNDQFSTREFNWRYLPSGYDSSIYFPRDVGQKYESEVFFAGTGYEERVALLSYVDWENLEIDLTLFGHFSDRYKATAPFRKFVKGPLFQEGQMNELAKWTCGADIAVNLHRQTTSHYTGDKVDFAESMNPRCYEATAAGTFLLTDDGRPEIKEVFGDTVGYFELGDLDDFRDKVVYYTNHPKEREEMSRAAMKISQASHTWNHRAELLEEYLFDA